MNRELQPNSTKHTSFEVYRYQLVIDQAFQSDAFQHQYNTPAELKAAKNNIFKSIITENNFGFKSSKSDITSQLVYQKDNMFYFLVNARRNFRRPKKDFTEEVIDTYPNFLIAINNDPQVQKIAIQHNPAAFNKTSIVANFLKSTIQNFRNGLKPTPTK